jgi:hypothetical protein
MKFLVVLFFLFSSFAFADTPGAIGVRKPVAVAPYLLDTSGTNVTSAAWVTFLAAASNLWACSAVQIHNTGSQPIKLGFGAAAAETETGILFPIGVSILLPVQIAKGVRLSVRSMGATQSSGFLTMSCLQ